MCVGVCEVHISGISGRATQITNSLREGVKRAYQPVPLPKFRENDARKTRASFDFHFGFRSTHLNWEPAGAQRTEASRRTEVV
ncbi:Protein of unknown function [Gryllus bimaculatus]|nr:Protein of unknown function [Gryllus bimaculatus]